MPKLVERRIAKNYLILNNLPDRHGSTRVGPRYGIRPVCTRLATRWYKVCSGSQDPKKKHAYDRYTNPTLLIIHDALSLILVEPTPPVEAPSRFRIPTNTESEFIDSSWIFLQLLLHRHYRDCAYSAERAEGAISSVTLQTFYSTIQEKKNFEKPKRLSHYGTPPKNRSESSQLRLFELSPFGNIT